MLCITLFCLVLPPFGKNRCIRLWQGIVADWLVLQQIWWQIRIAQLKLHRGWLSTHYKRAIVRSRPGKCACNHTFKLHLYAKSGQIFCPEWQFFCEKSTQLHFYSLNFSWTTNATLMIRGSNESLDLWLQHAWSIFLISRPPWPLTGTCPLLLQFCLKLVKPPFVKWK